MNEETRKKILAMHAAQTAKAAAKDTPQDRTGEPTPTAPQQTQPAPKPQPITPPKPEAGKIYNLMTASGKTMQEIKQVTLPIFCEIHCIGTERDCIAATIEPANANGRQKCVRLSDSSPTFFNIDVKYMNPISEKFGIGHYYSDNFKTVNPETVKKYIAMAEEAANPKPTPPPTPAPAPEPETIETPELSNITSADLIGEPQQTKSLFCNPLPFELPAIKNQPQTQTATAANQTQEQPKQSTTTTQKIQVVEYSPLSFVVTGEGTKNIKSQLAALGGKPNWHLKNIGFGWVFSNKKLNEVKELLQKISA
jgi:hypothetical protein